MGEEVERIIEWAFAGYRICEPQTRTWNQRTVKERLVQSFRNQRIDGAGLPMLTEEHLTTTMNMKLGPALKLRSILAKKLGSCSVCLHCTHCHTSSGSPEPANPTGHTSDSGGAS